MAQKRLFGGPPVASIEQCIDVYPAVLLIVYRVVTHSFPAFQTLFSRQVYRALIVIVAGLMVLTKRPTARAIASGLGVVSHDALTRLLTHTCWNASVLMGALLNQALLLTTGSTLPSYLILDDVVIPKSFSRWIAGAYWDWEHVEQRKVFCHRVVVVVWTNGVLVIPVAFALWHKKHSAYFLSPTATFSSEEYPGLLTQYPHLDALLSPGVTAQDDTVVLEVSKIPAWSPPMSET